MSTTAAAQLYPSTSAEELAKQQSDLKTTIEYENIEGTPFRAGKHNEKWHLLMGNWKITKEGEECENIKELTKWMNKNMLNIMQRMAACICYDFMKPLATIQGIHNAGGQINLDDGKQLIDDLKKARNIERTIGQ